MVSLWMRKSRGIHLQKEITLEDLTAWIDKNKHRTWNWESILDVKNKTLQVKYLRFNLDTRDMKIFHISVEGMGSTISVDFREDFEGNLLEELERKLDANG